MRTIAAVPILLLITVLFVTGCTQQAPATPAPPALNTIAATPATPVPASAIPLTDREWTLSLLAVQGGTAPLTPTAEVTLTFKTDGTFSGYTGCNNYFGTYTLSGETPLSSFGIAIGSLGSTKKYCNTLAEQESMYLAILQKATGYSLNPTQLTITDADGNVLTYRSPVPA